MRPRVLLVAEAANPEWVSVPLVGWSLATALRAVADVHIVTQVRNRDAFLRAGMIEGEDFTAIDSEAVQRPVWWLGERLRMGQGRGWTTQQALASLTYPWFERLVWRRFGDALRAGRYDIVHRVTPLSPTAPSPLAARCARAGVPFVVGPLNGGVPWPPGFEGERLREREFLSYLRGAYRMLPGRRAMLRHAAAILVGSRHTESEVPAAQRAKCVYLPENAVDPARFFDAARPAAAPLTAAFVGRMVPYKGPDMLIEAAAPLLREGRLLLHMVGDGPMMPALRAQAEGLPGLVFHGWLPHERVQAVLSECHLLAFPSVREFGGGVVLEAMATGVVPLIVDYAGPGELVGPETGIKVPIGPRASIVAGFAGELSRLADAPRTLAPLAAAGRARVAEAFTWQRKAEQVGRVYEWVLAGRPGAAPVLV